MGSWTENGSYLSIQNYVEARKKHSFHDIITEIIALWMYEMNVFEIRIKF